MDENFDNLSIEELETTLIGWSNERRALREKMLRAKQVLERKIIQRDAELGRGAVVRIDINHLTAKSEVKE